MRPRRIGLLPLVSVLVVIGCTNATKRDLVGLQAAGAFFDAANRAMVAIDDDPDQRFAWKILDEVADDAFVQRLERAREFEARGRLEDARDAWVELGAYIDKLRSYREVTFDLDGLDELKDVEDRLAAQWFEDARAAADRGDWSVAVDRYTRSEELRPGTRKTRGPIVAAYRGWAKDDVERHRYREAIAHWDTVFDLTGDSEARAWSQTIWAGLGRYALRRGNCRQAFVELMKAGDLPFDRTLEADRDRARACARTELVVLPLTVTATHRFGSTDLGALVSSAVGAGLREKRTQFLALLDPEAVESGLAPPVTEPGKRFRLAGTVTQLETNGPDTTTAERGVMGEAAVPCLETSELAACRDDVRVRYRDNARSQSLKVSATVTLVDVANGEQMANFAVQDEQIARVTWADHFERESGDTWVPVRLGTAAKDDVIGVSADVVALLGAPPELPTEAAMLDAALAAISEQAVTRILAVIDTDAPVPAPESLTLSRPIISPEDFEIGAGVITVERPEPEPETAPPAATLDDLPAAPGDTAPVALVEPWVSMGLPLGPGLVTSAKTQALTVQYGKIEPRYLAGYFTAVFEGKGWSRHLGLAAGDTYTAVFRQENAEIALTCVPFDSSTLAIFKLSAPDE